MTTKRADELLEGDVIDLERDDLDVGEPNEQLVQFENVVVESVGGGYLDGAAGPGEVVLYSTESLAVPVVLPAGMVFELED